MKTLKIALEKQPDGCVAYPFGLKGMVVGEGDTSEAALGECQSAVRFHIETFGPGTLADESPMPEAFTAEAHAEVPRRHREAARLINSERGSSLPP